jgi:cell division protein FtsI (penicillin-binding protein 3)
MSWRIKPEHTKSVAYSGSASPLLTSKTPVWRSKFLVAGLAIAFAGLAGRAAYVQVYHKQFFVEKGDIRFSRQLELPATRGRILDRNGLILASSVPAPSIWAIPDDVEDDKPKLAQLAKLLDMTLPELKKKLAEDRNTVWLRRQVDEAVAQQIAALGLKGIHSSKEYRRHYPENEAAAHVVGFTDTDDNGREGMEKAFNNELAGRKGTRRVIKDRLGRVVEDVGETVKPVDGKDLYLSIDSKVQFFAYQKLRDAIKQHKAKAGSVVVLDVQSGEVLALANFPSYNPSNRVNLNPAQVRNRALTDTFEPGSTMKPFVAAMGLEKKWITPESRIDTSPGYMTLDGAKITDVHPHGVLSVNEIIQKSSNVGTVRIAMKAEPQQMWEFYSAAGFGQKPQLPFPGVVSGKLRAPKTWRRIEQATMSYGYGLSASLFQLARSYSVFARDGELIPMSLSKAETQTHEATGVRVISVQNAQAVRKMLQMATSQGGTAPKAQTDGYSVGGKSGTARKQEGKGYAENKYRSWFVGLAPIDKPRIVVAVMVDEPSNGKFYGGEVAAPVFSETVAQTLRTLGVQPDMAIKPQIMVQAEEESF